MDAKPAYELRAERAAELRAEHAKALAAANIPVGRHERLLEALGSMFEVYAHRVPAAASDVLQGVVTAAEQARKTARWAEKLRARLRSLPPGLRFSIVEYLGYRNGEHVAADLPRDEVLRRAKRLQSRTRRNRGRPRAALSGLLFEFVLLFEDEFPDGGITNTYDPYDADPLDRFDGRLLDLAQRLLDVEGIRYTSRHALGRELWKFTKQARTVEERHAAGKCARCESAVADADRWLCDECFAKMTAHL